MTDQDLPDDDVDRGMAVAFGREGPRSVLAAMGTRASCIALRESPHDDPSPLIRPLPAGQEGRYQVLGEVARGAVGVVLKGHDIDLGRSVALKVLRPEHAENASVVKRFIEEAQVGGQLQHPGIVPVYEMGIRADGKTPWFAMKLVKGRTLSALLDDRKSVDADRRRFLGIFEQICQTVAYAHSRGVVHRDLKPLNVMVGAFGEVQVVDWGFAKVLQRSNDDSGSMLPSDAQLSVIETVRSASSDALSVVGSVFGTPAYMPPEQARGMVDEVDERSDVFALGAILCEILTGEPAYLGEGRVAIRLAAAADLANALARLDACSADPGIVRVCKDCLVAAKSARPAVAGEVAAAVAAYFAAEEEKARSARVAAVESRAAAERALADAQHAREVAEHHRRQRRLSMAVGAAFLLVILAVSGSWAWLERDHAERVIENSSEIEAALAHAAFLRGRAVRLADAQAARDAVRSARRANELAVSRDVDPELLERTVTVVAEATADSEAAAEIAKALRQAALLQSQRRGADALDLLDRVMRAHPDCAELQHRLAVLQNVKARVTTDVDAARAAHRAAIALDEENITYRTAYHDFLMLEGDDLAAAEEQTRTLRELDPEEPQFVEFAFEEAVRSNRLDDARRLADQLREERPTVAAGFEMLIRNLDVAARIVSTGELPSDWERDRWGILDACLRVGRYATVARIAELPAADLVPRAEWRADQVAALRYAALRAGLGEGVDTDLVSDLDRRRFRDTALVAYRDGPSGDIPISRGQFAITLWYREVPTMPGERKPRPGGYTPAEILQRLPPEERETWRPHLLALRRFKSGIARDASAAWNDVLQPGLTSDVYRAALLVFQNRIAIEPEDYFSRNGLGAAQYRLGLYDQAITTMRDVEEAHRTTSDTGVRPSTLSFLAMSLARSGRSDEAREVLARMRDLAGAERFAGNAAVIANVAETTEVVESTAQRTAGDAATGDR